MLRVSKALVLFIIMLNFVNTKEDVYMKYENIKIRNYSCPIYFDCLLNLVPIKWKMTWKLYGKIHEQ